VSRCPAGIVPRSASLLTLAILVPLGLGTKAYHGLGEGWVHESAGDVLNGAFWLVLTLFAWPRVSLVKAGIGVFLYCAVVELSQLLHTAELDSLRRTLPGRLLLGSQFDIADIGWGAVGIGLGMGVGASLRGGAPCTTEE
jgi:hypothetical protein